MLWLFLKSSNNSCLLLNMKDNLSESCSQNPYTVWVVTSLATASLLSSGKVFIQLSSKWAHFVDWTSSSCTSVAIELIIDLFMWHRHKWTSACFCMPSACSMQSILDLVHALSCHWTVNLRMFFVRRHRNQNVYWLPRWNIFESNCVLWFSYKLGWDYSRGDLAENAIQWDSLLVLKIKFRALSPLE